MSVSRKLTRNVIQELLESQTAFKTNVSKVTVYGLDSNQDLLTENGNATVTWELISDYRDWGVKMLDLQINSVDATWDVRDIRGEGDTYTPSQLHWKIAKPGYFKCAAEVQHVRDWPFQLRPVELEIHLVEKQITVIF
jgi:hypothetical protein